MQKRYKVLLTRQSVLLVGDKRSAFFSNELEFRRFANEHEVSFLENQGLPVGELLYDELPILDDEIVITIGEWELAHEPEDWSRSNDGGDYETYMQAVYVNGELWNYLQDSSCDINHCCEITGNIDNCEQVFVEGQGFSIMLSEYHSQNIEYNDDGKKEITAEEFLTLLGKAKVQPVKRGRR